MTVLLSLKIADGAMGLFLVSPGASLVRQVLRAGQNPLPRNLLSVLQRRRFGSDRCSRWEHPTLDSRRSSKRGKATAVPRRCEWDIQQPQRTERALGDALACSSSQMGRGVRRAARYFGASEPGAGVVGVVPTLPVWLESYPSRLWASDRHIVPDELGDVQVPVTRAGLLIPRLEAAAKPREAARTNRTLLTRSVMASTLRLTATAPPFVVRGAARGPRMPAAVSRRPTICPFPRGTTREGQPDAPQQPEQRPDQNATHGEGRDMIPTPVRAEVGSADHAGVTRPYSGPQHHADQHPNPNANDLSQHDQVLDRKSTRL